MRREGFELSISRPRVLYRQDPTTGQRLEPIEEVVIDVDEEFTGIVIEKLGQRRGELNDMRPSGGGKTRLVFHVPGARPDRLSRRVPDRHPRHRRDEPPVPRLRRPISGAIEGRRNGVLISNEHGDAGRLCACGTWKSAARCSSIRAKRSIEGMIIGENSRGDDLDVNPLKAKQLTNIRATVEGRGDPPDAAAPITLE